MKPVYFFALLALLNLVACVPARQYQDMEAKKRAMQYENDTLRSYVKRVQGLTSAEREEFEKLKRDNKRFEEDITVERERYTRLETTNRDILSRYNQLIDQMQKLDEANKSNNSGTNSMIILRETEMQAKSAELQRTEILLREREAEVQRLKTDYEAKVRDLQSNQSALQGQLSAREQRVAQLETAIRNQKASIDNTVGKINTALNSYFAGGDITVTERNGKVRVSMSQNLLFPSGSKVVDKKGKDALKRLAFVLSDSPDMDIYVEGHTDTDGNVNDNWDLSVLRATSVVKELAANGVEQRRMLATGRGAFVPVAPNDNAANKAQNRRTEIILSPKIIDDIYQTLNK